MSLSAKYVIMTVKGVDFAPFIFPGFIKHDAFVRMMGKTPEDVSSAGFVSLDGRGRVTCFGESVSLKKRSCVEDAGIIAPLLYNNAGTFDIDRPVIIDYTS